MKNKKATMAKLYKKHATQNVNTKSDNAESFITKGKQRLKKFNFHSNRVSAGGFVYLNDGDTFEIEMFNPHSTNVLARLKLNGKYITSTGIILRPGERVFLERFLDKPVKFRFSTYEVDDTDQIKKAIVDNGNVEIEYFDEYVPLYPWMGGGITWTGGWNTTTAPYVYNPTTTGTFFTPSGATFISSALPGATYSNSSNIIGNDPGIVPASMNTNSKIETGRIENGGKSDQHFVDMDIQFNTYTFKIDKWKILPLSQKPIVVSEDVKLYCTDCGARIKKSNYKFCPHCGTQVD